MNQRRPIHAVFILEKRITDSVATVGPGEALFFVLRAAMDKWGRYLSDTPDERSRTTLRILRNVSEFMKVVPVYRLCVSLNGEFWKEIERILCDPTGAEHDQEV